MTSENPYKSPSTDAAEPQEVDSRLRVIPATFLGFFASVAICFGIWIIYQGSSTALDYHLNYASHSGTSNALWEALTGVVMFAGGVLAAIATGQLMRKRWRAAGIWVGSAVVVVVIVSVMIAF